MTNQRLTEQVRRKFTDLEILAFKDHLASKVREHLEQKARRKEAVDGFNAVLKNIDDEIVQLSDQLEKGYEWVSGEVIIYLNSPEPGMKTVIQADTREELRTEPMTDRDRQQSLGFEDDSTQVN